jgi:sugar lactone lactonase YvrE
MAGDAGVEAVVNIATPKVTACAFGGENLDQLFITTPQETRVTGCVDASKGNLVDMNGNQ